MHKLWISILANATDEALAGVKVKIGNAWYRPVLRLEAVWYEGPTLIQPTGPITEIKMPVNESLTVGGSSGCGQ